MSTNPEPRAKHGLVALKNDQSHDRRHSRRRHHLTTLSRTYQPGYFISYLKPSIDALRTVAPLQRAHNSHHTDRTHHPRLSPNRLHIHESSRPSSKGFSPESEEYARPRITKSILQQLRERRNDRLIAYLQPVVQAKISRRQ